MSAAFALIFFYLAASCAGYSYTAAKEASRPIFETVYNAEFTGRLTGSPYTDSDGKRFVCTLTDITVNGADADFDMRLYLRGEPDELAAIGCGQYISGTGHVFFPEASTNPHEYDFGDALWNDGLGGYVSANISSAEISGEPRGISHMLFAARTWLSHRIDKYFPESSDLVRALIIGDRRDMTSDLREDFSIAGVAHLLAISGLHVTMIASVISALLKRLIGAWPSVIITLICVFSYGALVGFSPSITRAAIMYAVICTAPVFGRPSEGTTRLAFAFLITLIINPLNISDPGFVLSFSASAGLIWLSTPFKNLLRLDEVFKGNDLITRTFRYIAELFCATTCAQMATYPALAMFYGTFSVISLFSNLLLVPLCLGSLIASYIALFIPSVAAVPDALLCNMKYIVSRCADIGWAEISVSAPRWWLWLGIALIGFAVSEVSLVPRRLKPWLIPLIPSLIIVSILLAGDPESRIVVLDAGQADSAVVCIGDYACVIDVGEDAEATISYINGESLEIDALFLTHPHSDHAGGLGELAKECDIGIIYVPEGWFDEMTGEGIIKEWNSVIDSGVEYMELEPGDIIYMDDGASIEILDCSLYTGDSGNDISLVMYIDYGVNQILFTGDAKVGISPDIDILKVSHHGSRDATNESFIASATPETAIISVGNDNKYGHPDEEVLLLLDEYDADIYRTDKHGAITVTLDKYTGHKVSTFLEDIK